MAKRLSKTSDHYVNGRELFEEVKLYREEFLVLNPTYIRDKNKKPKPEWKRPAMSDLLGGMILKISNRIATKPNFARYTYKDEMICDGVADCLKYLHNFNPEKYENAFAYVSQIIHNAFIRRLKKEKKQQMIKYKCFEAAGATGMYSAIKNRDVLHDQDPQRHFLDHLQISVKDIETIENESAIEDQKKINKGKKKKDVGLDKFFDNE